MIVIIVIFITNNDLNSMLNNLSNRSIVKPKYLHNLKKNEDDLLGNTTTIFARLFAELNYDGSNCPKESWLQELAFVDPSVDKVFINVGFNKGYNYVLWLNIWLPRLNITSEQWIQKIQFITKLDTEKYSFCGNCNECKLSNEKMYRNITTELPSAGNEKIQMIGIDLNKLNVELADKLVETLPSKEYYNITNIHATISDKYDQVYVEDCQLGFESCQVIPQKYVTNETIQNFQRVQQYSLDIMYHLNIFPKRKNRIISYSNKIYNITSIIDILLIDAEGYDPLILIGTQHLFKNQLIRMIIFENNVL